MSELQNVFTDIANAIRSKANSSNSYTPYQMVNAINDIPTGDVTKYTTLLDGIIDKSIENLSYEGHTNIGGYSFNHYDYLKDVDMPNVQTVGYCGFYECTNLRNVNMPNVTFLNNYAFDYDILLKNINMPNLIIANGRAFNRCGNISGIVEFPNLTDAGEWAFGSCGMTDIILPNVVNVGSACFAHCPNLTNVVMNNCNNFRDQVFYNCRNLVNAYLPNAQYINAEMFYGCRNLSSFDFTNVAHVGRYAFRETNLLNINIGVENNIDDGAFMYCYNLTDASFPNLLRANSTILYSCYNLFNAYMPNVVNAGSEVFRGCNNLINVYLPNLEWVSNGMFEYCTNLSILDFPKVNAVNEYGFYGCANLDTLILRANEVCNLRHSSKIFYNTPFNGYKPATLYVPNDLISSYQSAANWSTVLSTTNVSILPIEGGIYE